MEAERRWKMQRIAGENPGNLFLTCSRAESYRCSGRLRRLEGREMCDIPGWIQYLQAFSTPAIALLAATIGTLQWRTAHQRAVLDLFDRRMESFDSLNAIISEVIREGRANSGTLTSFDRAVNRARFLFGSDIAAYLQETRDGITGLWRAEIAARSEDDAKRAKAADLEADQMMKLTTFFEDFAHVVRPYVRMHQKAPPF